MLLSFVAFECYQKTYWKQLFLLKAIFKIVWKCSVTPKSKTLGKRLGLIFDASTLSFLSLTKQWCLHVFYHDKQLAIAEEDVNYLIFTESRDSDLQ